jgi:hypothetical protein
MGNGGECVGVGRMDGVVGDQADRERTVLKKPPFLLQEQGWGEFDMELVLHAIDKGGDHLIKHDLNFQKTKYESVHTVVGCPSSAPSPLAFVLFPAAARGNWE